MTIYPVVNTRDRDQMVREVGLASEWGSPWVHFDVSDGVFTSTVTGPSPDDLPGLHERFPDIKFEVHLMVTNPEEQVARWFEASANRVVVHWEAIGNPEALAGLTDRPLSIALNPETAIEDVVPRLKPGQFVHVLAVPPGPSGQTFDLSVVEKITSLRSAVPDLIIEVDGGITPQTAALIKEAANAAVSHSYIFGSPNPEKAFRELQAV